MTKGEILWLMPQKKLGIYEHKGVIIAMYTYAEQVAIGFSDWQRTLVFTEKDIWLK